MSSEDEEENPERKGTPAQETKFPDENPRHHEVSSLPEVKETIFRLTPDSPPEPISVTNFTPDSALNTRETHTTGLSGNRSLSAGTSEPHGRINDSLHQDFSIISLRQSSSDTPGYHHNEFENIRESVSSSEAASTSEATSTSSSAEGGRPGHEPTADVHSHDPGFVLQQEVLRESRGRSDSYSSSASSAELRRIWAQSKKLSQESFMNCPECEQAWATCNSRPSRDLWEAVEGESSNPCHTKYFNSFITATEHRMKTKLGKPQKEFLKLLLDVEGDQSTNKVRLSMLTYVMRFLGPLLDKSGHSPLLQHVNKIVEGSTRKVDRRCISWFAGQMTREEADKRLKETEDKTFLTRLSKSGADEGNFVLSVKYGNEVHHFEIDGYPEGSLHKDTFDGCLTFGKRKERFITDIVKYHFREPIEHEEDDGHTSRIYCCIICPDLPFNSAIEQYKKVK